MATFLKKVKLLKGLLTGETAYTGPFFVLVDITRRCNLQCVGCRVHSSRMDTSSGQDSGVPDISFELFQKLCLELKAMGTQDLILTGDGEPLLHDRILDMISLAKKIGFHLTLVTNGTLLDRNRIQSLLDLQLDALQVSLWASSQHEYEKNCPGVPADYFNKVVESVTLLNSLKIKNNLTLPYVTLHHPINRHNFQQIDQFSELALATGCNAISFSPFYTWQNALNTFALSLSEENALMLSLEQIKKRIKSLPLGQNIDQTCLRYQMGRWGWKKVPCYIGWLHTRIKTDGKILPCNRCNTSMGNMESSSLKEIWNDLPFRNFRKTTLTREGLESLKDQCDCKYCCFVKDNLRVHRIFKWFPSSIYLRKGGRWKPAMMFF